MIIRDYWKFSLNGGSSIKLPSDSVTYLEWYDGLVLGLVKHSHGVLFICLLSRPDKGLEHIYFAYFVETAILESLESWRDIENMCVDRAATLKPILDYEHFVGNIVRLDPCQGECLLLAANANGLEVYRSRIINAATLRKFFLSSADIFSLSKVEKERREYELLLLLGA